MISYKSTFVALLIFLFSINSACADKVSGRLAVKSGSIAGFNITESPSVLVKRLLTQYGDKHKKISLMNPGEPLYCYYSPQQNSWFEVSIYHDRYDKKQIGLLGIFATKTPICPKSYIPKKPLPALKNFEGIGLGDSKSKILKTYGKPWKTESTLPEAALCEKDKTGATFCPKFGHEVLTYYGNPWWTLSFHLTNDRVQSIGISPEE